MRSPWYHNEITMILQWEHVEITMISHWDIMRSRWDTVRYNDIMMRSQLYHAEIALWYYDITPATHSARDVIKLVTDWITGLSYKRSRDDIKRFIQCLWQEGKVVL